MLKDILDLDMIELAVEANDWQEAIRLAGEPLVKKDKVKAKYIENMIDVVKDLGPYIVIMPGVAFAHARPDESVNETCISLITLKTPVNFGSAANDPVSIIFAFAAQNSDSHVMALQEVANFLSVDENVELLKTSTDKKKILDKILETKEVN